MKGFIAFILMLALFATLLAGVDFVLGYEVYRDVLYGDAEYESMDVFVPKAAYQRKTNGCVLLIHGGSWSGGDKRQEELMARYIAENGYIAVTVNYKLSTGDGAYNVFDVLDEIDMAFVKICDFSLEKGIIVDKAATYGYSAGAHLSMLYSYSRTENLPINVKFTANMAGPADFDENIWGEAKRVKIAQILSGATISDDMINTGELDEMLDAYSPVNYVSEDTPASIFAYGGKDTTVPIGNGESLKARFDAAGVRYEYVFFKNSDHSLLQNFPKRVTFARLLIEYCDEYFS